MPQTELEKFDAETEELKAKNESMFKRLSNFGFIIFTLIPLGFVVGSNADSFKDKAPLTHQSLRYISIVGLIAFAGTKASFNTKLIAKLFCAVGLWMLMAFCLINLLHPREINEVPTTIIVSTGCVTLSIFSMKIYCDSHELAKRQRMRSRIIIDAECDLSAM